MTYRELANAIEVMTEEQKSCDISVYDPHNDEIISLAAGGFVADWDKNKRVSSFVDGVLDNDHPFLVIDIDGV